ncbi:MAG: hypothetical protein AAF039_13655 [Bacteroidota bacterium]
MKEDTITYANGLGEFLAPILKLIRATGFFEAYVFMPVMTLVSIYLFIKLRKRLRSNGTFDTGIRAHYRKVLLPAYYSLCFMAANVFAVALKTLIIEEMDYVEPVWFLHLVGPLHFYIESVVISYLWLISRNRDGLLDKVLCVYIQLSLLGGYSVAVYRLLNEPFELTNPTTGFSGVFMMVWYGILNTDIVLRFFSKAKKPVLV